MENVVILSCVRTPIGAYGGSLKNIPVYKLGAVVLQELVKRVKIDPAQVDDVIMGSSYQNGECANGARMAVLEAGGPDTVPGIVLDRRCCSGIDAIFFGAMKIQTGNADIIIAGGMDSMSQAELYIPGDIRGGLGGDSQEKITREEADNWAFRSHQKAIAAQDAGKFAEEIVPVPLGKGKTGEPVFFSVDEGPRRETTLEKLAKLKPVYADGVCTAGNSSSENDGASVVMLASEKKAKELGVKPLAYFRSCAIAATDPTLTYPAVPASVQKALQKIKITIDQVGLIEIQEAFAVQALADARLSGIKDKEMDEKVNVNGSGISLGHPIGATGVMRLTTLINEMTRRNTKFGLETICGGGGQGICMIVERK